MKYIYGKIEVNANGSANRIIQIIIICRIGKSFNDSLYDDGRTIACTGVIEEKERCIFLRIVRNRCRYTKKKNQTNLGLCLLLYELHNKIIILDNI